MVFGGENAESYYDEGITASMKGNMSRAVQYFEKAIRLDNTLAAAYHQLGKCFSRLGQHQRAVEILSQVVAKKPSQKGARLDLGFAYIGAGAVDAARNQFQHLLSIDPDDARAHLGLAMADFRSCDWAGAMSHAEAAIRGTAENFNALFLLGRAARLAGEITRGQEALKKAEKLIEKLLEVSPEQPEGHFLRGEVYFAQDRFDTALEQYLSASRRAHTDTVYSAFGETFTRTDVLGKLGLCYQRLGQNDEARRMGKAILEVEPAHRLGQSLAEL
jgi:tetratricopeptide (TPR) repeat protein